MTEIAKLRHHRLLGVQILIDFKMATPETAAEMVERVEVWERDLIRLVEPFGDGAAARFKPLTPMHPYEQLSVAGCMPLDEGSNNARREHAVRMYRLDDLFKQFPPELPKGKGGNRRTIDDRPIVDKARAYLKSSGTTNKRAAARYAMAEFPELVQGSGDPKNIAKRIAGKI